MKYKIISIMLIVPVFAIHDRDHRILENTREQNENGYNFRYATSDGQERQETGRIAKVGENLILRMSGSHSYISSDGNKIAVVYEADENGYKPNIYFKPSTRTSSIDERTQEKDSQMPGNPSSYELVTTVAGQATLITETTSGPVFNVTENMEVLNISTPAYPEKPEEISSAAIASLAGGGLG